MNKCSCVYVAAVKLTLSDLAYKCLFDNSYSLCPNKRKYQEDDGMNFTRAPNSTPTTQLFLVTKINLQRKKEHSKLFSNFIKTGGIYFVLDRLTNHSASTILGFDLSSFG